MRILIAMLLVATTCATARADELLGWNNFKFGMTRQAVMAASNGTGENMTDSSILIPDVDYAGEKVQASFYFDQLAAGETADQHLRDVNTGGSMTRVELNGYTAGGFASPSTKSEPCSEFEPKVKAGLTQRYGDFYERALQRPANQDPNAGPRTNNPRYLMDYGLYKAFANNTFIFGSFKHANDYAGYNIRSICQFKIIYGVKSLAPPPPPKLPAQGY